MDALIIITVHIEEVVIEQTWKQLQHKRHLWLQVIQETEYTWCTEGASFCNNNDDNKNIDNNSKRMQMFGEEV